MIIMSKLEKKLYKIKSDLENAVVLGTGFGHLTEILTVFKTVFLFADSAPLVKARNLIYRTDLTNLQLLTNISVIFADLDHMKTIDNYSSIWIANKSLICVEGGDLIVSNVLASNNYTISNQYSTFHIWKRE
jgi:hypothetical protein